MSGSLLTDQLRLMAGYQPNEVAYCLVDSARGLTFAEWDGQSDRVAAALIAAGVGKGDRVAVYLHPEEALQWVVAYSAVHKAGAVAVPTSHRMAPLELVQVFGHAGCVAAITGESATGVVDGLRGDLPELRWLLSTAADPPAGFERWDRLPESGPVQVPLGDEDIADIVYTSGTTGRPKGVVVRHGNIATIPNGRPPWTGDGWLHASPLFTFAGIASVYNPMKLGMTGLYLPRFDAGTWLEVAEERRPVAAFLVPSMAQLLVAHPRFGEADLSSIRVASLGSAPVAPETLRQLQAKLPQAWVSNNWGMTEAGSAFCMLPPEEAERRVGSVGKPVPPVRLRVLDESGQELPAGQVGELVVSNPGQEREYFRDEEATAAMWRDGWLHTGDLAYLDDDGYLYIAGRKKDVIIRGGNNIYAVDVEAAIMSFDGVLEAAVAGVPHDVLGEDVAAWVVRRPGASFGTDDLRGFLAVRLADYKVPRRIYFVDTLPRNPTGKVVKSLLEAPAEGSG